jgi:hypothetical protein
MRDVPDRGGIVQRGTLRLARRGDNFNDYAMSGFGKTFHRPGDDSRPAGRFRVEWIEGEPWLSVHP